MLLVNLAAPAEKNQIRKKYFYFLYSIPLLLLSCIYKWQSKHDKDRNKGID